MASLDTVAMAGLWSFGSAMSPWNPVGGVGGTPLVEGACLLTTA